MAGLARQFGTTWRTVWRAIKPLLEAMAAEYRNTLNCPEPDCPDHPVTVARSYRFVVGDPHLRRDPQLRHPRLSEQAAG